MSEQTLCEKIKFGIRVGSIKCFEGKSVVFLKKFICGKYISRLLNVVVTSIFWFEAMMWNFCDAKFFDDCDDVRFQKQSLEHLVSENKNWNKVLR